MTWAPNYGTRDANTGWSVDPASGHLPGPGVGAHFHPPGEIVGDMTAPGFVMLSPNGARWRVTVSNAGALVVTAL